MYEIKTNEIPIYLCFTILCIIFLFFLITMVIKMNARYENQRKENLHAIIEERERTMYTISVEIHNNYNQILSLVKMAIRMMEKSAIPAQSKYILESIKMLDTLIGDLGKMSHSLNSDFLKHRGLYDFISEEIKWINISKELRCTFEATGIYKPLLGDTELILIRIIQEVLQNVLKHAQASSLEIYMNCTDDKLILTIKDNGIGFNTELSSSKNGMGLQSIYNRCKIINCDVSVISKENIGTEILLHIKKPWYKDSLSEIDKT